MTDPGQQMKGTPVKDDKESGHQARKPRQRAGKSGRPPTTFDVGPEIEAVICEHAFAEIPQAYPPQTREGMVTKRWQEVAASPGAALFCDMNHRGDHAWPVGYADEEGES